VTIRGAQAPEGGGLWGNLGSPTLGVQDVYANFDIPERVLEGVEA
jgi:hypothetical protein